MIENTERYLMEAAIFALLTIFSPPIIIGALFGWNGWSPEGEYVSQVMRLAFITILIPTIIIIEVSRKKHPQLHQEGYAIAEVSIIMAIIINAASILVPSSILIIPVFEKIEFKSISATHTYTVTVNFMNTGPTSTSIASVLLNGIFYNDSGWAGTVKPMVTGNLTLKSVIAVGASNTGIITFSDDCVYIPSGYRLTAGATVKITIHTTGGKDYDASVTLP
jgi:hypothetical protein